MKDLRRRIEVEPLSERAWRRIEAGTFVRLEATSRHVSEARGPARGRWMWAGAACAALAASAIVLVAARSGPDGAATASRIDTGASSSVVTVGESELHVAPRSSLVVTGDDEGGVQVALETGAVDCRVPPRRGRPPFVVQAGRVRVEVVGTRFYVEREGEGARVAVTEGKVRVLSDGRTVMLSAGQAWPAPKAIASASEEPAVPPPPAAPEELDMEPLVLERRRPRPRALPRPRDSEAPMALPPAPGPSARERFERAARLEPRDPGAADAIYRDLAGGEGAWAALALFARARLAHDQGQHARARTLLEEYLRRFPDGANRSDALALLDRLR